jgi:tetratricopeptide (TPR) repeat protein
MGDDAKAILYFERAIAENPNDANPLDSMGEIYFRMGMLGDAVQMYERALAIKPDFGSHRMIAYVFGLEQRWDEAIEKMNEFTGAMSTPGMQGGGYFLQAFVNIFCCRWDKALASIEAGEQLLVRSKNRYGLVGLKWLEAWNRQLMGEYDLSRACIEECESMAGPIDALSPRNVFAANLVAGLDDLAESRIIEAKSRISVMQEALTAVPDTDPVYTEMGQFAFGVYRAEIMLAEGAIDDAIETSLSLGQVPIPISSPANMVFYNFPAERDLLARAYAAKGETDKAIAEYKRLLTFDPSSGDRRLAYVKFHYRLGLLLEKAGSVDEAAACYRNFIDYCGGESATAREVADARKRLSALSD